VTYGYIRAGSRSQVDQEASIARQQTACRLLAATCGLRLTGEFVDRGARVTDDQRPAFERLITAVEQQERGVYVLLASSDRLAPTPASRRQLTKAIVAAGGQVLVLGSVRLTQLEAAA
jgi:DNA invertase Pin-like site-specific DNA recombinase